MNEIPTPAPLREAPPTREIGGRTWRVTYFVPSVGIPLLGRIAHLLAPIGDLDRGIGDAIRRANLGDPAVLQLLRDLLQTAAYRDGDRWMPIYRKDAGLDLLDHPDLFIGPAGLETLFRLVAFAAEVNFSLPLLSSRLGGVLRRIAEAADKTTGDESPSLPISSALRSVDG